VNGFGSALVSATKRLMADDGAEDTPFQSTSAEPGEKSLDSVEPGARAWCEVENETRVAIKPGTNVGMFVSCIVVKNDVDNLADRNLRLDGVQKSNEFLMTMTLHVAADDRAVEDGEQRRGAVPLVIVCHGSEPALLQRQAWLGAIEGLDLALLVDRQHDGGST
jgi:hypothetical protein